MVALGKLSKWLSRISESLPPLGWYSFDSLPVLPHSFVSVPEGTRLSQVMNFGFHACNLMTPIHLSPTMKVMTMATTDPKEFATKSPTLAAIQEIRADRVDSYGNPEDNFTEIGNYWAEYINQNMGQLIWAVSPRTGQPVIKFRPADVAKLMALLKIARDNRKAKLDNSVDGANYLIIAGDLQIPSQPATDGTAHGAAAPGAQHIGG